jgi:hypothetical protein
MMQHVAFVLMTASLATLVTGTAVSTVYVSNSTSSSNTTNLLAALEDQDVTQIVLTDGYYSVGTAFDPYVPAGGRGPLLINRCGTAALLVHFTAICSVTEHAKAKAEFGQCYSSCITGCRTTKLLLPTRCSVLPLAFRAVTSIIFSCILLAASCALLQPCVLVWLPRLDPGSIHH